VRLQLGKALVTDLAEAKDKDTLDDVKDVTPPCCGRGTSDIQLSKPVGTGSLLPGILAVGLLLVGTVVHLRQVRVFLHFLVLVDGTIG